MTSSSTGVNVKCHGLSHVFWTEENKNAPTETITYSGSEEYIDETLVIMQAGKQCSPTILINLIHSMYVNIAYGLHLRTTIAFWWSYEVKINIYLHKSAVGLGTSYGNILLSSLYTVNGKDQK